MAIHALLLAAASGFMSPMIRLAASTARAATCPATPNILMLGWNDASLPVTYGDRQSEFMYGPESQTYIEGRQNMMYGPYREGYYGRNSDMVRDYDYRNRRIMNDPYRRDSYDSYGGYGGYGGYSRYGERNDYYGGGYGRYGDYGNRYRMGNRYRNNGPNSYNYGRLNNFGRGGRYDYGGGYGRGYYDSYDRGYGRYRGPGFGNEVDDYGYDSYDRGMVYPTNRYRYGPGRGGYGDYDRYRSSEVSDYSYDRYYDRY